MQPSVVVAPNQQSPQNVETPDVSNFSQTPGSPDSDSIIATLERLGGLRDKGYISEEEFSAKKSELLNRL